MRIPPFYQNDIAFHISWQSRSGGKRKGIHTFVYALKHHTLGFIVVLEISKVDLKFSIGESKQERERKKPNKERNERTYTC